MVLYLQVFTLKLGLVRGKYLPAGLHAAEAFYVSSSSISAFRAAIVRAVRSSKMPLANAPAILNLLDGPVDVDPAFHIVWSRFRMMRRYLAYCPEEEPRIFRMLDLIARGAQGHGPVHLLLISAAELGFAWDGNENGWVRVSLPPLRMMTGPVQHFRSSILEAWRFSYFFWAFGAARFFGEVNLRCTFQVVDAHVVVLVVLAMLRSCRQRQFVPKAGYAGFDAPRLCSSRLLQAKILDIMAVIDQNDSCVWCPCSDC